MVEGWLDVGVVGDLVEWGERVNFVRDAFGASW